MIRHVAINAATTMKSVDPADAACTAELIRVVGTGLSLTAVISLGVFPALAVQATLASTANSAARKHRAAPYTIRRTGFNLNDLT